MRRAPFVLAACLICSCDPLSQRFSANLHDVQFVDCPNATTLDFGHVEIGFQAKRTLSVANHGFSSLDVRVSAANDNGAFFFQPLDAKLAGASMFEFGVFFAPDGARDFEAQPDLDFGQHCPAAPILLRGTGVDKLVEISPETLAFGYETPGAVKRLPLVVTNNSDVDLTVDAITSSSEGFTAELPDGGYTVAAATSGSVWVDFSPSSLGQYLASLRLSMTGPAADPAAILASGRGGGARIELAESLVVLPDVAFFEFASPPDFDFASVEIRNVGSCLFGDSACGLSVISVDIAPGTNTSASEFTLDTGALAPPGIPLGGAALANLRFTPASPGSKDLQFTLNTNDPGSPSVALRVQSNAVQVPPCILDVSPMMLDLGSIGNDLDGGHILLSNLSQTQGSNCLISNLRITGSPTCFETSEDLLDHYVIPPSTTLDVSIFPNIQVLTDAGPCSNSLNWIQSTPGSFVHSVELRAAP